MIGLVLWLANEQCRSQGERVAKAVVFGALSGFAAIAVASLAFGRSAATFAISAAVGVAIGVLKFVRLARDRTSEPDR